MATNLSWMVSTERESWRLGECVPAPEFAVANLTVTGNEDQVWEGFGGCFNELGWMALGALSSEDGRRLMAELFDPQGSCRFNFCRLPIGASDFAAEWYSHNEHDGDFGMAKFSIERDRERLLPFIRLALEYQPELKLFASPWSPPAWMKYPKAYNHGRLIWKPEYLKAYALYFARFVQAYAAEGVRIDQVHVQNEPVADQKFPSCLWSGEQMREFMVDYLAPCFEREGVEAEIWLGTLNTDDYAGYPLTVLSDEQARACVKGVGFQWAGKGAVQRTHQSWPELRLMQTENECGDGRNSWDYAHYVFALLRHYLANGVNAYIYWNLILEQGGVSTWGWRQNSLATVEVEERSYALTPEFRVMQHFSHVVSPGARRLEVSGHWAGNAVAFRNRDGGQVVMVDNPLSTQQELRLQVGRRRWLAVLPSRSFNTFVVG